MDFDVLYELSELSLDQYQKARDTYLTKGQSTKLIRYLLSRSKLPNLRNLSRPPGEIYAPVTYTKDYIIKYIQKDSWGVHAMPDEAGHKYIVAMTLWDLLIIDIDNLDELPYIKRRMDKYYPDELFYIHRTPRGHHIYLVSRLANHLSGYAIYMRLKLGTDVAHGSNSLYTGASIRLTRKESEPLGTKISTFVEQYGGGTADEDALKIYHEVVHWLDYFHDLDAQGKALDVATLSPLWKDTPDDFGKVHVSAAAPYLLGLGSGLGSDAGLLMNLGQRHRTPELVSLWSRFLKYSTLTTYNLAPLLACVQYQMGYDNLYRIFDANKERAIGVHVQHNVHFISYRDLLFLDYDNKARLAIVARYARANPECVFRVVRTTKGYHVFLTSHRKPHNSLESLRLLMRLRSDPAHIIGVYHRGYSVRINQKKTNEKPYREIIRYGKGVEDPALYALYQEHLDLYTEHRQDKTHVCQYQIKKTREILKSEGMFRVY